MNGILTIVVGLVLTVAGQDLKSPVELNYGISSYESEDRIINGTLADEHSRPWMVTIATFTSMFFCGGVLIDPQWVLTAAHCVIDENNFTLTVLAGTNKRCEVVGDIIYLKYGDGAVERNVSYIYMANYDNSTPKNDIALLKLVDPFPINENIKTVKLPTGPDYNEGDMLETSGWGRTNATSEEIICLLSTVSLPVVSYTDCKQDFPQVDESHLCAGDFYGDNAACNGDSGGPLVKLDGDSTTLYGITSFSAEECEGYTVFANVSYYLDWIRETMKSADPTTTILSRIIQKISNDVF